MALSKCRLLILAVHCVLMHPVLPQTTTRNPMRVRGKSRAQPPFLLPYAENSATDRFTHYQTEFLLVDSKVNFHHANLVCQQKYDGEMAVLNDLRMSKFMAEALSETNLDMDTLWVAGSRNDSAPWYWKRKDKLEEISSDILELMVVSNVSVDNRNCLGFGRLNHDQPQFRPLDCEARRGVICERPVGGGGNGAETHPGWIKLGKRLYKIYSERIPFEQGEVKCFKHDKDAALAVVTSFEEAQYLGRYLLVGRPSLENAWIGAKWEDQKGFVFEAEDIVLRNTSDSSGFPPWRGYRLRKTKGCLLIDRHLANITLFVEAHCQRIRPYVCYKTIDKIASNFSDVFVEDRGYRLVLFKMSWPDAREFCNASYFNYGGKMVEIRHTHIKFDLLYVMGENLTNEKHIWIGGSYEEAGGSWQWQWSSDGSPVQMEMLNMVNNQTYESEIEDGNTCLNMDRENHITAIHYGTFCNYGQHFVCDFTAEKLRQLEHDEDALLFGGQTLPPETD